MYVFVPFQKLFCLFGPVDAGIVQYDRNLLTWRSLIQLGQ